MGKQVIVSFPPEVSARQRRQYGKLRVRDFLGGYIVSQALEIIFRPVRIDDKASPDDYTMMNKPLRVYADTSVYGGVFEEEFEAPSRIFFGQVRAGLFHLVTSPLLERELVHAPKEVWEL